MKTKGKFTNRHERERAQAKIEEYEREVSR